jgi:hypothetical protein
MVRTARFPSKHYQRRFPANNSPLHAQSMPVSL